MARGARGARRDARALARAARCARCRPDSSTSCSRRNRRYSTRRATIRPGRSDARGEAESSGEDRRLGRGRRGGGGDRRRGARSDARRRVKPAVATFVNTHAARSSVSEEPVSELAPLAAPVRLGTDELRGPASAVTPPAGSPAGWRSRAARSCWRRCSSSPRRGVEAGGLPGGNDAAGPVAHGRVRKRVPRHDGRGVARERTAASRSGWRSG